MSDTSIQSAYDEWSSMYDSNVNLTRDLDAQILRETLIGRTFQHILEIGCGTGKNTVFLAEIGQTVHALDFSEGMLAKARARVQADNVHFETADLTRRWNCADGRHDLIVCCLVLEHIQDLSHIFTEAARVLAPGGGFLIHELHPFKQYLGTQARFERDSKTVEVTAFTHHISEFTNTAIRYRLRLFQLNEHWHAQDSNKPPRLISFYFEK
jgi:malonyl-CoA O-methyltransferase